MTVRRDRTMKAAPIAPTRIRIRRRSLFKTASWNAPDILCDSFIKFRRQPGRVLVCLMASKGNEEAWMREILLSVSFGQHFAIILNLVIALRLARESTVRPACPSTH